MKRKKFIKEHILPYEDDKTKVDYYEGRIDYDNEYLKEVYLNRFQNIVFSIIRGASTNPPTLHRSKLCGDWHRLFYGTGDINQFHVNFGNRGQFS